MEVTELKNTLEEFSSRLDEAEKVRHLKTGEWNSASESSEKEKKKKNPKIDSLKDFGDNIELT